MNSSETQGQRVSPYIAIFFGILAVSTASIFIRYAQQDVPSLVIAAYRLGIASLLLAVPAWLRHRQEIRRLRRMDLALMALSGVFLALHFATWITSLEMTTVVNSVVLVTTTPLWVALLSPLLLRESLGIKAGAGMLVALAGGAIIAMSSACQLTPAGLSCADFDELLRGGSFLGNFLALAGAWMAAGYLIVGRSLRSKLALIPYIFLVYGTAAIFLFVLAISQGFRFTGYPALAYLWLVLLAIFPQLIGHSIFNWALGYLPASFVAVTLLGEPIGSSILAFLLLGEAPTMLNLIGAILILSGIVLVSQGSRRDRGYEPVETVTEL